MIAVGVVNNILIWSQLLSTVPIHVRVCLQLEFACAFHRLCGKKVLFPQGFHCTGMPIKVCTCSSVFTTLDVVSVSWGNTARFAVLSAESAPNANNSMCNPVLSSCNPCWQALATDTCNGSQLQLHLHDSVLTSCCWSQQPHGNIHCTVAATQADK